MNIYEKKTTTIKKISVYLSVSNNLFMIEVYNRQCAKIEGLESELKLQ